MKVIIAIMCSGIFFSASAQQYKPVDDKSEINFTIKNFGLNTEGSLKGLKGSIKFDQANINASSFEVSVDVNTINTGVDGRDSHLKKEEYFDVQKYPVLKFVSTSINNSGDGYSVKGNLSIKGTTKSISISFTVDKSGDALIFTGNFSINRKDFGVGGSSAVMGSNVDISLKVFAAKA